MVNIMKSDLTGEIKGRDPQKLVWIPPGKDYRSSEFRQTFEAVFKFSISGTYKASDFTAAGHVQ